MIALSRSFVLPLVVAAGFSVAPAPLSDPIGIYGIIDKVVFTPNATAPTAIQLWGSFTITEGIGGDHYKPAAKGYLYFTMNPSNERAVRAEWADLQSVAGKGQIVGFGAHYTQPIPRIRCATEAPVEPDVYAINMGIVRGVPDPPNTIAKTLIADLTSGKAPAVPCRGRG
jgi:hypothetical protein